MNNEFRNQTWYNRLNIEDMFASYSKKDGKSINPAILLNVINNIATSEVHLNNKSIYLERTGV